MGSAENYFKDIPLVDGFAGAVTPLPNAIPEILKGVSKGDILTATRKENLRDLLSSFLDGNVPWKEFQHQAAILLFTRANVIEGNSSSTYKDPHDGNKLKCLYCNETLKPTPDPVPNRDGNVRWTKRACNCSTAKEEQIIIDKFNVALNTMTSDLKNLQDAAIEKKLTSLIKREVEECSLDIDTIIEKLLDQKAILKEVLKEGKKENT